MHFIKISKSQPLAPASTSDIIDNNIPETILPEDIIPDIDIPDNIDNSNIEDEISQEKIDQMKLYLIKAVEEKNPEYFEHNLNLLKKFKFTDFEMKDTSRKITLDKQPQFKPSN